MSDILRAIMRRITSGRNIRGERPIEPTKENYVVSRDDIPLATDSFPETIEQRGYSSMDAAARDYQRSGLLTTDLERVPTEHNYRKALADLRRQGPSMSPSASVTQGRGLPDRTMIDVLADIIGRKQRGQPVDMSPQEMKRAYDMRAAERQRKLMLNDSTYTDGDFPF